MYQMVRQRDTGREGVREGGWKGAREGERGREGGREGEREEGRGREGGAEGGREGRRERGREGGGGREVGRQGGREGEDTQRKRDQMRQRVLTHRSYMNAVARVNESQYIY